MSECSSEYDMEFNFPITTGLDALKKHYHLLRNPHFAGLCATSIVPAIRRIDGQRIVMKFFFSERIANWTVLDCLTEIPSPIVIMTRLGHIKGVVHPLEVFNLGALWAVTMEEVEGCHTLAELVENAGYLSDALAKDIFKQLVNTVQKCHDAGVILGGIQENDILVSDVDGTVRLCGFSYAAERCDLNCSESVVGLLNRLPPECLKERYWDGIKRDVWSFGILLYHMLYGELPYSTKEDVLLGGVHFPRNDPDKKLHHLIKMCLHVNPQKRPRLQDLLSHTWTIG